ncbi:MAG: hypothetical protein PVI27_02125 [Desulfobacteraceae bacterium]|jgi:Fe-S-cluster containining protein
MLLQKKFQKAVSILGRMRPNEVLQLKKICRGIQASEERLLAASTELIQGCTQSCGGLCCRNLKSGQIIDLYDFVFILTAAPAMKPRIRKRVGHQPLDFTADCVFLEHGVGPCIFPFNTRPEVCITSFCGREEQIGAEIREVTRRFAALRRFVLFQKPRRLQRRLQRLIPGRRPPGG